MASSPAVFEVAIRVKSAHLIKSCLKNRGGVYGVSVAVCGGAS